MQNPYPKTEDDERWRNATLVPNHLKLRWLWFDCNGTLWSSIDRIQYMTRHSRDYILPVLERHARMYGPRPEWWYEDAYNRIEAKYRIGGRADHYYPELRRYGTFPEGDYTPVEFDAEGAECPYCHGDNGYLIGRQGEAYSKPLRRTVNKQRYRFGPLHPHTAMFICREPLCREVREYVTGDHGLASAARNLNVPAARPIKRMQGASPEDAFAIAAAALLDWEARCMTKKQKLKGGE